MRKQIQGGLSMPFCSYCGCQTNSNDRFCPNCGASLVDAVNTQTASVNTSTTYTNTVNTTYTGYDDGRSDYEVILSGLGSCATGTCNDLLEDLLGYTDNQASELIAHVPVKIGDNMTFPQAQTVAQALTEYGALVSVVNVDENVDISATATSSLFNSDGSFIQKALAILSTITLANRVTSYTSYKKPSLLERIFRLPFRRKEPPKHIRRPVPRRTYVRPQYVRPEQHRPLYEKRPQQASPRIRNHEFRSNPSPSRRDNDRDGRGGRPSGGPSGRDHSGPGGRPSGGPGRRR